VLALPVAAAGVRLLVALSPPGLPRMDAIALNGPVFAFAFAVAALVGLAAGLAQLPQFGVRCNFLGSYKTGAGR
jgi:hypothetical protein